LVVLLLDERDPAATLWQQLKALVRRAVSRQELAVTVRNYWPFLLTLLGFAVFVLTNRGIALEDKESHPFPEIHFGNLYLLLFLAFFLFLPLHIAQARTIWHRIRTQPVLIALALLTGFLFYLYTFVNDHPNNQSPLYLRNRLLVFAVDGFWHKMLFFIPIACTALSLLVLRLPHPGLYLLYPFTALYLLPEWFILERYLIIPVVLFLLFTPKQTKIVEYATLLLYLLYLLCFIPLQWSTAEKTSFALSRSPLPCSDSRNWLSLDASPGHRVVSEKWFVDLEKEGRPFRAEILGYDEVNSLAHPAHEDLRLIPILDREADPDVSPG
jgi:hypothetical protein